MSIFRESFLEEKVVITTDQKKSGKYIDNIYNTNLKIDGVTIQLFCALDKELQESEIEELKNQLDKDYKILKSNYNKIIKDEFAKLMKYTKEWDMEVSSVSELVKMAKLNSCSYKIRKGNGEFELFFNDGKNFNADFFGGHCFILDIEIRDNKAIVSRSNLAG